MRSLLLFLAALPGWLSAQLPVVDITMVQMTSTRYEVRIRPDGDFDGVFSSLVFTARWSASSAVTLGSFQPTQDMMSIGIFPFVSGDVETANGYNYASYTADSPTSLAIEGLFWTAGQEVVLGTIEVEGGGSDLQLVNDAWTLEYNGDFYVSLNGVPSTGVIYGPSTGVSGGMEEEHRFTVECNPHEGGIGMNITSERERSVDYDVLDAIGRTVMHGRMAVPHGRSEHVVDLAAPSGAYTVWIRSEGSTRATRVVLLR